MVNYVHFILSGKCRLIEHMLVRECSPYYGTQYELYNSENSGSQKQSRRVSRKNVESDKHESNQLDKSIPVRVKRRKLNFLTYCFFSFNKNFTLFLYVYAFFDAPMHSCTRTMFNFHY